MDLGQNGSTEEAKAYFEKVAAQLDTSSWPYQTWNELMELRQ